MKFDRKRENRVLALSLYEFNKVTVSPTIIAKQTNTAVLSDHITPYECSIAFCEHHHLTALQHQFASIHWTNQSLGRLRLVKDNELQSLGKF